MSAEIEIDLDIGASGADEVRARPVQRDRHLGRYILCYELASGGMATVYLARADGPRGFEKLVALKLIHPHLANETQFVEMFLDEARIAARIAHPNVCSVFDFGEADGTYFIAMEYLVGETVSRLSRAIARQPELQRPQIPLLMARIIADACEGLHAAHELVGPDGQSLAVVHRDVTPQNLFVGYDGSVRVVDFGVASAVGRVHQTTVGTLKGKYGYMAPEQVIHQPLDRRADVFSLGVCLWEMLTLRRLFRRPTEFETLRAVTEAPIPPVSSISPHAPPELDAILARALEREPAKRYPSAREFGAALNGVINAHGGANLAEIAELMQVVFSDEREKRAELIEKARKLEPDAASTSAIAKMPLPYGFGAGMEPTTGTLPSRTMSRSEPSLELQVDGSGRGKRRGLWIAAALATFALVAVGVFAATASHDDESAAPVDTPPPSSATDVSADQPVAESAETEAPPSDVDVGREPLEGEPADTDGEPAERHARGDTDRTHSRRERAERAAADDSTESDAHSTGTVNIVTPPGWAEVFVGRRHVGRSPTEVRLPSGRQTLRIMPYGEGPPILHRVQVPANGVARVSVRLP